MAEGKRTRRKKLSRDVKGDVIRLRVTDEQKRLYAGAAKAAGLDVSNWLRFIATREAKGTTGPSRREEE